jgi:hypothetical protein
MDVEDAHLGTGVLVQHGGGLVHGESKGAILLTQAAVGLLVPLAAIAAPER